MGKFFVNSQLVYIIYVYNAQQRDDDDREFFYEFFNKVCERKTVEIRVFFENRTKIF